MTYDTKGRSSKAADPRRTETDQAPQQQQPTSDSLPENETSPPVPSSQAEEQMTEEKGVSVQELIAAFPVAKLASLTSKISNTRWVVPVLPEQELECLLNAAIELSRLGVDHDCEPCIRFYRDGMTTSFVKILTDEAVNSWKPNIHYCILVSCGKLLQLCALHMKRDNPYLLDLLTIVLDPDNKFHTFNANRSPEMFLGQTPTGEPVASAAVWGELPEIYAHPLDESRSPRGWLVDLLNRFGQSGGFDNLLARFSVGMEASNSQPNSGIVLDGEDGVRLKMMSKPVAKSDADSVLVNENNQISLPLIHALLRPFGQCYELLTTTKN